MGELPNQEIDANFRKRDQKEEKKQEKVTMLVAFLQLVRTLARQSETRRLMLSTFHLDPL